MKRHIPLLPRILRARCSAIFNTLTFTCIVLFVAVVSSRPQTVVIADLTFHLASTNSSRDGFLKEYLPQNQTVKDWTNLFAERSFKKPQSPQDYIAKMNQDYHQKFPYMSFATGTDAASNRWWSDFIMRDAGQKVAEWNFFRAETNASGGILVYQYAERRRYKKSVKELDSWDLKNLRMRMLPILKTNDFSVQ